MKETKVEEQTLFQMDFKEGEQVQIKVIPYEPSPSTPKMIWINATIVMHLVGSAGWYVARTPKGESRKVHWTKIRSIER